VSVLTIAFLAHQPIWVGWKQEMRAGRPTKVPYDPRTGRRAEADNPTTWATGREAEWWAATQHGDGVGIMLGPIDGDVALGGIDLDSCRDPLNSDAKCNPSRQ
jgi:putative DNA primase/helicase